MNHPVQRIVRRALLREGLLKTGDVLERLACNPYWRPDEILSNNAFTRRAAHDVFTIGEGGPPWPATHLMVGDNGGGDYFFIHLDEDRGLWFFSSEGYAVGQWYQPTLEGYLEWERRRAGEE